MNLTGRERKRGKWVIVEIVSECKYAWEWNMKEEEEKARWKNRVEEGGDWERKIQERKKLSNKEPKKEAN